MIIHKAALARPIGAWPVVQATGFQPLALILQIVVRGRRHFDQARGELRTGGTGAARMSSGRKPVNRANSGWSKVVLTPHDWLAMAARKTREVLEPAGLREEMANQAWMNRMYVKVGSP